MSAIMHFLLAPLTHHIWQRYSTPDSLGSSFPVTAWMLMAVYFVFPGVAGTIVGAGISRGWAPMRVLTALKPPKAWDHVFGGRPNGWIKLKLKSGEWLGGWYGSVDGDHSYAAGYPHVSDLYLVRSIAVDQETGTFVVDEGGQPLELGPGILVRWDEVEYLKVVKGTR